MAIEGEWLAAIGGYRSHFIVEGTLEPSGFGKAICGAVSDYVPEEERSAVLAEQNVALARCFSCVKALRRRGVNCPIG